MTYSGLPPLVKIKFTFPVFQGFQGSCFSKFKNLKTAKIFENATNFAFKQLYYFIKIDSLNNVSVPKCTKYYRTFKKSTNKRLNINNYTTIHINEAISLVLLCALLEFSKDFQVTINFLQSDLSTQPDSHVIVTSCPATITFFKMAACRIVVMNNDIAKFGYDSMQQITKKTELMKTTSPRTFKVKFLTCNVFVFYKNLLYRLRSSRLRHNVYNGVKCK